MNPRERERQDRPGKSRESQMPPVLEDQSYLAYIRPTPRPFLNFASGHFPASTVTTPHSHPCIALHGCLHGPLTLCSPEGEHALESGVLYLIGPGVRHSWRNPGSRTVATLSLLIDAQKPGRWPALTDMESCCRELQERIQSLHRFSTSGDRALHQSFWQVADQLTTENPLEPLALTGALLSFLSLIKQRVCGTSVMVDDELDTAQQIRRLLLTRVEERLSIPEISRELATSPTKAKEIFRKSFGCGIMSYFNQLKIWRAKRLLSDSSLTVDQISHQLGFTTASYFSRTFLKHVGETPSAYRQSCSTR